MEFLPGKVEGDCSGVVAGVKCDPPRALETLLWLSWGKEQDEVEGDPNSKSS